MTVVVDYHCRMAGRDVDPNPTFSERNVHTVEPARMPANGRAWLSPSDPAAPIGFRLMVTPSGYRAYYLIYRPRNGDKARAYRIGPAEDLSYKEAKTRAETIRGIVAHGKDPVGEEQAARERKRSSRVVTLRDVFAASWKLTGRSSTPRRSSAAKRRVMLSPTPCSWSRPRTSRLRCSASLSATRPRPRSCRTDTSAGTDDVEPGTWALVRMASELRAVDYAGALKVLHRTGRELAQFLVQYDALLTPTMATPPPRIGVLSLSNPDATEQRRVLMEAIGYTQLANIAGTPAMSVPLWWNTAGLPIGVQFIGRHHDEATLFRLAAQLEQARPWFARRAPAA